MWDYNFFSIGVWEQKLCPNKLKRGERGQQKNICKNLNFFLNFFAIDYIFVYFESFDSFYLDLFEKIMDNLIFQALRASS